MAVQSMQITQKQGVIIARLEGHVKVPHQTALQVRVLVDVIVLRSLDHAERMAQVPGTTMPEQIFQRMHRYSSRQDQSRAGTVIAVEQVQAIRAAGWSGRYLMSPSSTRAVLAVLAVLEAGLS